MVLQRTVVRRGVYFDSVSLMIVSRNAQAIPGVQVAGVVQATPLNLQVLEREGFAMEDGLGPNDLVIAVRADHHAAMDAALDAVDQSLAEQGRPPAALGMEIATSIVAAARRDASLNLAFISVPGYAAPLECMFAIERGLHVFCFSDGISLVQEATLKREAARRDLLFMGPDCGTSIIHGVALGFANSVRRGPVGIIGASGTGIQEVSCLLDLIDIGISHAIGVGGRDLKAEIGGMSTQKALDLLAADAGTDFIVIVSKPPDEQVATVLIEKAGGIGKPVVLALVGIETTWPLPNGVFVESSLEAGARRVARLVGSELPSWNAPPVATRKGFVRGLFSGGTLCYEAMFALSRTVGRVESNTPLHEEWRLVDTHRSVGHTFVDFGEDEFTVGRAHPIIDPSLRNARFTEEARDPDVGAIVLDVVLGFGAPADPAAELAPLIREALAGRGSPLTIVVALCGTKGDPQQLELQRNELLAAGAVVTPSSRQAAVIAMASVGLSPQ